MRLTSQPVRLRVSAVSVRCDLFFFRARRGARRTGREAAARADGRHRDAAVAAARRCAGVGQCRRGARRAGRAARRRARGVARSRARRAGAEQRELRPGRAHPDPRLRHARGVRHPRGARAARRVPGDAAGRPDPDRRHRPRQHRAHRGAARPGRRALRQRLGRRHSALHRGRAAGADHDAHAERRLVRLRQVPDRGRRQARASFRPTRSARTCSSAATGSTARRSRATGSPSCATTSTTRPTSRCSRTASTRRSPTIPAASRRNRSTQDPRQARDLNVLLDAGETVQQARFGFTLNHRAESSDLNVYGYVITRDFDSALPILPMTGDGIVAFNRVAPGGGARWTLFTPVLGFDQTLTLGIDLQYQDDDRSRYPNIDGDRGPLVDPPARAGRQRRSVRARGGDAARRSRAQRRPSLRRGPVRRRRHHRTDRRRVGLAHVRPAQPHRRSALDLARRPPRVRARSLAVHDDRHRLPDADDHRAGESRAASGSIPTSSRRRRSPTRSAAAPTGRAA